MIIRIDDVSANTDMRHLDKLLFEVRTYLNPSKIYLAVSPICSDSRQGSVYPDAPFKAKDNEFFYNVDSMLDLRDLPLGKDIKIASHGLIHIDHTRFDYQYQLMSILTSCSLLNTKVFIPPFNFYNHITEEVCQANNIRLIKPSDGWKSLDYHKFDSKHKFWYFHPWRWTIDEFRKNVSGQVSGFVPSDDDSCVKSNGKSRVL